MNAGITLSCLLGAYFVNKLVCVRDDEGTIQAFMGVHDSKIEMLFVSDECRGKGIGKSLVEYAINSLNILSHNLYINR